MHSSRENEHWHVVIKPAVCSWAGRVKGQRLSWNDMIDSYPRFVSRTGADNSTWWILIWRKSFCVFTGHLLLLVLFPLTITIVTIRCWSETIPPSIVNNTVILWEDESNSSAQLKSVHTPKLPIGAFNDTPSLENTSFKLRVRKKERVTEITIRHKWEWQ